MIKPQRPGEQLRAMVQVRLIAQPEVQRRIAESPRNAPVVGPAKRHERDDKGRWTIPSHGNYPADAKDKVAGAVDGIKDKLSGS